MERELAYRKAKKVINKYLQKCKSLQGRYWEQGKEAARIGDSKLLRRFAVGYLSMQEKIMKAEKIALSLEGIKLQREEVGISTEFVGFAKEMSESIMEGADTQTIAKMQTDLEKALTKAEEVDMALTSALDVASESILSSPEVSEEGIEDVVQSLEGEVEASEGELDIKIEEGLKKVEEAMKKG